MMLSPIFASIIKLQSQPRSRPLIPPSVLVSTHFFLIDNVIELSHCI